MDINLLYFVTLRVWTELGLPGLMYSEAAIEVFLKFLQYLQENICIFTYCETF